MKAKPAKTAAPKKARAKKPPKEAVPKPLTEVEKFFLEGHCQTLSEGELAEKLDRPVCEITPAAQAFLKAARHQATLDRFGGKPGTSVYLPSTALADEQITKLSRATEHPDVGQFRAQ